MAKKNRKAEAPERKQSAFPTVVVIYLWILLILGGGALWVLRDFLQAYELSRPSYCVADYEAALGETVPASALRALDSVDARIMSDAEKSAWVQALLRDASMSKDSSQSWEEHQVYFIQSADGQKLGSVVFEPVDTAEFRMPVWGVTEESFDFSAYYRSTGITVPAGWQVRLGELPLGPESVAEDQIPFALLAECYLHYENLPTMVRYETPPFVRTGPGGPGGAADGGGLPGRLPGRDAAAGERLRAGIPAPLRAFLRRHQRLRPLLLQSAHAHGPAGQPAGRADEAGL